MFVFYGLFCFFGVALVLLLAAGLLIALRIDEECRRKHEQQIQAYWDSLQVTRIRDGHQFEHFVAHKLNKFGMPAFVTPGSGDQGVDVIAITRSGNRIAIQCKLYSKNVTNKAIQEAYAGMAFHNRSIAVVVIVSPENDCES